MENLLLYSRIIYFAIKFQTTFSFFTPAPSYRLQHEQVGHLQALPGGQRVPNSDRCEYGMRLANTTLSFALRNPPGAVILTVP